MSWYGLLTWGLTIIKFWFLTRGLFKTLPKIYEEAFYNNSKLQNVSVVNYFRKIFIIDASHGPK